MTNVVARTNNENSGKRFFPIYMNWGTHPHDTRTHASRDVGRPTVKRTNPPLIGTVYTAGGAVGEGARNRRGRTHTYTQPHTIRPMAYNSRTTTATAATPTDRNTGKRTATQSYNKQISLNRMMEVR